MSIENTFIRRPAPAGPSLAPVLGRSVLRCVRDASKIADCPAPMFQGGRALRSSSRTPPTEVERCAGIPCPCHGIFPVTKSGLKQRWGGRPTQDASRLCGGPILADDATLRRLLAGIGRGEADQLAELYDLTSPKLYGLILRIQRDRALAEDVLQDVYMRIWQAAGTYGRTPAGRCPGCRDRTQPRHRQRAPESRGSGAGTGERRGLGGTADRPARRGGRVPEPRCPRGLPRPARPAPQGLRGAGVLRGSLA